MSAGSGRGAPGRGPQPEFMNVMFRDDGRRVLPRRRGRL
jgi:hypothetical protein